MSSHSASDPAGLLGDLARETYNAERNDSASNPGPQNVGLVRLNPNSDLPPPTDHGVVEPFWYSFDLTHRRAQEEDGHTRSRRANCRCRRTRANQQTQDVLHLQGQHHEADEGKRRRQP